MATMTFGALRRCAACDDSAMRITLELDEQDLARLEAAVASARRLAASIDECEAVDAARTALARVRLERAPAYVRRQFEGVRRLLAMIEDDDWALPRAQRVEVLATLVYVADPEDLIPDATAVLGLLDDAILAEVLLARLAPLLEAYAEFTEARVRIVAESAAQDDPERRHERARALACVRVGLFERLERLERFG